MSTTAKKMGDLAEAQIEAALKAAKLEYQPQYREAGESIWDTAIHADFLVRGLQAFPDGVFIESKTQSTNGSAYAKLPLLFWNIQEGCYVLPVIVVLSGEYMPDKAVRWATSLRMPNLAGVYTLDQFSGWLMRAPKAS